MVEKPSFRQNVVEKPPVRSKGMDKGWDHLYRDSFYSNNYANSKVSSIGVSDPKENLRIRNVKVSTVKDKILSELKKSKR